MEFVRRYHVALCSDAFSGLGRINYHEHTEEAKEAYRHYLHTGMSASLIGIGFWIAWTERRPIQHRVACRDSILCFEATGGLDNYHRLML
jgi:hypothetical protein